MALLAARGWCSEPKFIPVGAHALFSPEMCSCAFFLGSFLTFTVLHPQAKMQLSRSPLLKSSSRHYANKEELWEERHG